MKGIAFSKNRLNSNVLTNRGLSDSTSYGGTARAAGLKSPRRRRQLTRSRRHGINLALRWRRSDGRNILYDRRSFQLRTVFQRGAVGASPGPRFVNGS